MISPSPSWRRRLFSQSAAAVRCYREQQATAGCCSPRAQFVCLPYCYYSTLKHLLPRFGRGLRGRVYLALTCSQPRPANLQASTLHVVDLIMSGALYVQHVRVCVSALCCSLSLYCIDAAMRHSRALLFHHPFSQDTHRSRQSAPNANKCHPQ